MQCPRCKSSRVQRDYEDAIILIRLAGMHKLLCNNCGLVFKGFDPLGRVRRSPVKTPKVDSQVRRKEPRYHAHLPAAISLVKETGQLGKAVYSEPSRGHCETISKSGMGLSLVGTRIPEIELTRIGRLLFVRVNLPDATIEAVTAIVNHGRTGEQRTRKWHLGVRIQQMSDEHTELLNEYLERRAHNRPVVVTE